MNLHIIETPEGVDTLREKMREATIVAYDTETTGVSRYDRIIGLSVCFDPQEAFYVVVSVWNAKDGRLDELRGMREAAINLVVDLTEKSLIGHNILFDVMITEADFRVSLVDSVHTDTMVLAHILNENRKLGLKELARTMYGESSTEEQAEMLASVKANGGSLTKTNYEMYKADSKVMAKYGAKDALLTFRLFSDMVPDLVDQGLDSFFYEEESMPLLKGPTYQLNTTGLKVDMDKLVSLKKQLEAECAEAKDFIYNEIYEHVKDKYPGDKKTNKFNIGSSSQLSWLLFEQLGQEFQTLTDAGRSICKDLCMKLPYAPNTKRQFIQAVKDKVELGALTEDGKKFREPWYYIACDKKTLQKYSEKFHWVTKLLEYQKKMKLLTTYVDGILERTRYGVIHPQFLQTGTTSGRYSSRNPNFQNLPRDDKRIKACIVSRPGKVFVGADYSQLEPRVFAYYSQDSKILEAFNGETDFYSVIGMEVYDKKDCVPQKDGSPDAFGVKYKKYRDLAKVIALASTYGVSAYRLRESTGKDEKDTQADIDAYFQKFPRVKEMMLKAHEEVKTYGVVYNEYGRPRRIPEAKRIKKLYGDQDHADLPYDARTLLNLSINHKIQSTGASICNRAMISFAHIVKELSFDCKIVMQVHDEIVVECDEAIGEDVATILRHCMENRSRLEGVALEAIPKIGKNLGELK